MIPPWPGRLWLADRSITVTVMNTGDAGAEVPITLHMDGADSTERLQVNANQKRRSGCERIAPVHEIVVNDGSVPERTWATMCLRWMRRRSSEFQILDL